MFKAVSLVKQVPSLTREEFSAFWIDEFAPVAARLPGLRRYVVNVVSAESGARDWSGITELWFDSRGAYEAAFAPSALNEQLEVLRREFIVQYDMYFVEETEVDVTAVPESDS